MTEEERLALIRRWMHPGLWSGLDARRGAILGILDGFRVEPPSWAYYGDQAIEVATCPVVDVH